MVWLVLAVVIIPLLAFLFSMARQEGTPFGKTCPCAENVKHLRWREKDDAPPDGRRPIGTYLNNTYLVLYVK